MKTFRLKMCLSGSARSINWVNSAALSRFASILYLVLQAEGIAQHLLPVICVLNISNSSKRSLTQLVPVFYQLSALIWPPAHHRFNFKRAMGQPLFK